MTETTDIAVLIDSVCLTAVDIHQGVSDDRAQDIINSIRASLEAGIGGLLDQLEATRREIAALKSKDISCTLGVGDGSGGLFVHGNYDSIKATQKIIIERDALKGEQAAVALTVWYGSMPESNGKENWTAILHRKGGHISDGITVDRSEYPERVRYEADRMLYLIGEIQDEPDILAYDANKHSDYVNPVTAKKKPVINKEKLCDWLEDNFDIDDSQRAAFAACFAHCCDCVVQSHSPAPVGEIVAWAGTDREKGITREVDFRFLRFDVLPGTKLYAVEPEPAAKSDLLTRAQALAVETRALACRIKAGD